MYINKKQMYAIGLALDHAHKTIPYDDMVAHGLAKPRRWATVIKPAIDAFKQIYMQYDRDLIRMREKMAKRRQDPEIRAKHNKASRDYYRRKKIVG